MSPVRVLVVEDSATMRAFVVSALESRGFEVATAKSGFEALKVLPKERYQLIITDVNMPDINGLELVRYIRDSPGHKECPLILISTDGRERDRERGMKLGASAYLVKPFSPDDLLGTVDRYLGKGPGPTPTKAGA